MTCRFFIAVALLIGARALPAAADEPLREQSVLQRDASGITSIVIENNRGRVELSAGPQGSVRLTALKVVRASVSKQREIAAATSVETRTEGGVYRIQVRYPQRQHVHIGWWEMMHGIDVPSVHVNLTVEVPAGLAVRVRTTSGEIASFDLPNPLTLQTTSGDVEVSGTLGALAIATTSGDVEAGTVAGARIRTSSGDVSLERSTGPTDMHTASGNLQVQEAADSLTLGTVSGDIQVAHAARGVRAGSASGSIRLRGAAGEIFTESSSGDVELFLVRGARRADATSGSGDIAVHLASDVGAAIEIHTSNGSIDAQVPLRVRSASRRMLAGTIGNGATAVVLRSSSGDIQILGGGE